MYSQIVGSLSEIRSQESVESPQNHNLCFCFPRHQGISIKMVDIVNTDTSDQYITIQKHNRKALHRLQRFIKPMHFDETIRGYWPKFTASALSSFISNKYQLHRGWLATDKGVFRLSFYSTSQYSSYGLLRNKNANFDTVCIKISVLILVRSPGLEPGRLPIRPSNVRVCLFRHDRISRTADIIIREVVRFVKRETAFFSVFLSGAAHRIFTL